MIHRQDHHVVFAGPSESGGVPQATIGVAIIDRLGFVAVVIVDEQNRVGMVLQANTDWQPRLGTYTRPQENCRGMHGAGSKNHFVAVDVRPCIVDLDPDAHGLGAVEQDLVDKCFANDGEIRAVACRFEPGIVGRYPFVAHRVAVYCIRGHAGAGWCIVIGA